MKKQIFILIPCILSLLTACNISPPKQNQNHELWYTYPAKYWNSQALHLGNGFMGASFFGGVPTEKFALTEQSMWIGGPFRGDWEEYGINPQANQYLEAIREAVVNGNIKLADSLTQNYYLGNNRRYGSFTSIGDLLIDMDNHDQPWSNYNRKLDLSNSTGHVQYQVNDVTYTREYFCSYPNNVLAMKIKSNTPGAVGFSINMNIIQQDYEVLISDNTYIISGRIDRGESKFRVMVRTIPFGGKSVIGEDYLAVEKADSVVILVNASTDYLMKWPDYLGADPEIKCDSIISVAEQMSYEKLKQLHIEDYSELYSRVKLDLNSDPVLNDLPTNERWERFKEGNADQGLKELTFNYGRYLIISSTRPGTLPANLQGKWNTFYVSPWSGNYQANINIQEIYWPCGPVNLLECQEPYIEWTRDLVTPGKEIARLVYGTNGWISHTTGNIWGNAAPTGSIPWGVYPLAPVWHCQHLWQQYEFSMDKSYLEQTAYPIIKEAARFWLENLIEYEGSMIVAPSISAEHGAYGRDEYNLPGAYQDMQMLHDLFTNCVEAATILNVDQSFRDSVSDMRAKLLPQKIGQYGQLQEWYEDIDSPDDHHRHIAHLYAVCPGRQIHPLTTPELAEAAKVSLNMRGDGRYLDFEFASGGNWSRCWRIWCWTRLMDGNRANKIFSEMLIEQGFENLLTHQHADYHWERTDLFQEPDNIYLHFQLDASASIPGFMAEMLLQSHLDEIILLPALPDEWESGSVKGLKARGGYEIDIAWDDGELTHATITSKFENIPKIRLVDKYVDLNKDDRIEFISP
jgi:alpha-L-fucosidase 2